MKLDELKKVVRDDAAVRRRQRLQPVGGKGDKVFPPTYPGDRNSPPRHVYELRKVPGSGKDGSTEQGQWCVLVDSVQSQANRLEDCLLACIEDGVYVPHVLVDFENAKLEGISKITSLDAPHRIFDAILRDSLLDGVPFMESDAGTRAAKARNEDATALLELSPTALTFGVWHSTGEGGGIGAKFARCLVSEIIGIGVPVEEIAETRSGEATMRTLGRRTGSRIDPLGVLRKVEIYKGESGWSTDEKAAGKKAKKVRPSEINHGNIAPSVEPLGVTCDYLEHMFVLSFAALRRLRFGGGERDPAGRAMLAALGLMALTEQDARGYALRSRCDLVCDGKAPLEVVHADGSTHEIEINRESARALYDDALAGAKKAGFSFPGKPLQLTPQDKLVEIVRRSQELALSGAGGEDAEAAGE